MTNIEYLNVYFGWFTGSKEMWICGEDYYEIIVGSGKWLPEVDKFLSEVSNNHWVCSDYNTHLPFHMVGKRFRKPGY